VYTQALTMIFRIATVLAAATLALVAPPVDARAAPLQLTGTGARGELPVVSHTAVVNFAGEQGPGPQVITVQHTWTPAVDLDHVS